MEAKEKRRWLIILFMYDNTVDDIDMVLLNFWIRVNLLVFR